MNFRSDNNAPVAAEILAALIAANESSARAYGEDEWSRKLEERLATLFEHDVRVFPVSSGTAANAIALASVVPPWGAILCHREAHIERDECGAPEFFSGGAKLTLLDGANAKITPVAVSAAVAHNGGDIHSPKLAAISISQATERGAVYTPDEMTVLGDTARANGLAFHVDGARFGNAVAALGCAPADVTWRAGVDLLSFGATKNGAMSAEAIVAFNPKYAAEIERRRKRGGHLVCKGRYQAAQWLAYLDDGLWLKLARRANDMAHQLGEAAWAHLIAPVQTNQVFIKPGVENIARLRAAGADFYDWGAKNSGQVRLVVSWNQSDADIEAMRALLASLH
jgi:threonine aldolase